MTVQNTTSRMTVDEFLVWAEARPGRHELVDGRVYGMTPERVTHMRVKAAAYSALAAAIRRAGLPCEAFPDGATVRIDDVTAFEPDAMVHCGARLPGDAIEVPHPVIVVEVLSPSTGGYDKAGKLIGYFSVPSLQHYLIVDPDHRIVIHHQRNAGDGIATRLVGFGVIRLDPPGLEVAVEDMLGGTA